MISFRKIHFIIIFLVVSFLISGCTKNLQYQDFKHISQGNLKKVEWSELKEFQTDNLDEALMVFKKDCMNPQPSLVNICNLSKM